MKRILMPLFMALTLSSIALAIDPQEFKTQADELRFQKLTKELRCLVCQNENLADSSADLAKDLRNEIRAMVVAGKSDVEIKNYLTARYSDFVLYDPPLKSGTLILWFGPGFVLLCGAVGLWLIVRRRASAKTSVPLASDEDW